MTILVSGWVLVRIRIYISFWGGEFSFVINFILVFWGRDFVCDRILS